MISFPNAVKGMCQCACSVTIPVEHMLRKTGWFCRNTKFTAGDPGDYRRCSLGQEMVVGIPNEVSVRWRSGCRGTCEFLTSSGSSATHSYLA